MKRHVSAVVCVLMFNTIPVVAGRAQQAQRALTAQAPAELVVKVAAADVHKFPSVASAVIGKAPNGTVLGIRRNLGSWVEVSWPGTESGVAFLHVNTGAITQRTAALPATSGAQAAVAEIAAVADACMAAVTGNVPARSSQRSTPAPSRTPPAAARSSYIGLPSHQFGMGAQTYASDPLLGLTARTWWTRGLGVEFHVSRPPVESADGQTVPATQFAPSVLYSLPDAVTNNFWLRPYIGAGPRIYRAQAETGVGYETFGGVETTLAAMPQFSLSVDVGYRWSRPSMNGFEPREIGFALSGHWYVK